MNFVIVCVMVQFPMSLNFVNFHNNRDARSLISYPDVLLLCRFTSTVNYCQQFVLKSLDAVGSIFLFFCFVLFLKHHRSVTQSFTIVNIMSLYIIRYLDLKIFWTHISSRVFNPLFFFFIIYFKLLSFKTLCLTGWVFPESRKEDIFQ